MLQLKVQKIVKRSDFADLAGVSPAAVTRVCKTLLFEACVGTRIDAAHPVALEYLARRQRAMDRKNGIEPDPQPDPVESSEPVEVRVRLPKPPVIKVTKPPKVKAQPKVATVNVAKPKPVHEKKPEISKAAVGIVTKTPHVRGREAAKETKKRSIVGTPLEESGNEDMQIYGNMTLHELVKRFGTDVRFSDWAKAYHTLESIQDKQIKNAVALGELVSKELVKRGVFDPINETVTKLVTDAARTISVRSAAMTLAGQTSPEIEALVVDILQSYLRPLKARMERSIVAQS